MTISIEGSVASGFERVREVFARNFSEDIEVGAGFSVLLDGHPVVDLWGGWQDRQGTRRWARDTLVNVYSTTKGISSLAFATLVEDGLLRFEDPVSQYWPELRAAEGGLTVGQLLSHQGGLCGLRRPLSVADLYDTANMIQWLEAEEPFWPPGQGAGYHAILWGYFPDELARRVTGKRLGAILAERISGPLQADFHLGLPASEHARVADLIGPNHARIQPDPASLAVEMPPLYPYALQNPLIRPWQDACSPAWRSAEIAAANGQATAVGIARIYGAMARGGELDGVRVLAPDTIAALTVQEVGEEDDLVLGRPMRRGRGVVLNTQGQYGPSPQAFGHSGAGGSVGFADPVHRIGIGYAMNQMEPGVDTETRCSRLVAAVYECLGAVAA